MKARSATISNPELTTLRNTAAITAAKFAQAKIWQATAVTSNQFVAETKPQSGYYNPSATANGAR